MKVTLHGAAREVTGSCYRVETKTTRVLIDCGMYQGSAFSDAKNFRPFGFDAADVDAVIVTHTHLDHIGRLPKLVGEGFKGPIYLTKPTAELARIVLEDASEIMQEQFEREFRPKLYEEEDLGKTFDLMRGMDYSRWKTIGDLKFRFRDAGHVFGSAFVEIEETGGARTVFSGDLGNVDTPILRPTAQIGTSDAVFIESTYGNRIHEELTSRKEHFLELVKETMRMKGVLLIPSFAIERTQDLLYHLHSFFEHHEIEPVDVYIDSPMAIRVTKVMKEYPEYYDREASKHVMHGEDFLDFPGLTQTMSRNESKMINDAPSPKVIIAGSGMMTGGRILHHLRRYLGRKSTTLFIVGHQAEGTLGRRLYSGEKHVRIHEDYINVKAKVVSVGSFSAHADQHKLLNWIKSAKTLPERVYCTHGEEDSCAALATRMTEALHIKAHAPRFEECITI